MNKLLALIKKLGYEIKEEHEEQIKEAIPNTEGMLTQAEVDKVVEKRLKRERKLHETEIKTYEDKLEGLVTSEELEELKTKHETEKKELEKQVKAEKVTTAIKLGAQEAGAVDVDYILYQIQKKDYEAKFDDNGKLYLLNDKGEPMTIDGKVCGVEKIMTDLKEEFPAQFGEVKKTLQSPGDTNPAGGGNLDEATQKAAEIAKKHAEQRKHSVLLNK